MAVLEQRDSSSALRQFKGAWGWMVSMGLVSILLGIVALGSAVAVSFVSVAILGLVLLVAGLFTAIHAFWERQWKGVALHFLGGALMVVLGVTFLANPALSLASLTLFMATYFIVMGLIRTLQALAVRHHYWGWSVGSGLVTLFLGVIIMTQWPMSSLFIIGLFIGIDLLFLGMSWVMMGLGAHRMGRILEGSEPGPRIHGVH